MAEMKATNLRQAVTKITAVGLLTDKKYEIKTQDGEKHIEGSVTIKITDKNFVTFSVYCKEKKADKSDNKAYAGLVTAMEEFNTVADVGEENADYIRVSGQVNPYRGQNGNEIIGYRGSFLNRIKNIDKLEPEATFELEMFLQSIVPEMGKNEDGDMEETGRLTISGWMPTYNGIEPIHVIVPEELADAFENAYEPGQTVELYGEINNNKIVTVIEKPVAIGKPKKETRTSYINELIVTGGSAPYEDTEGDHVPYDQAVIEAAIQERKDKIEEDKNKTKRKTGVGNARPSGQKLGRTLKLDM